MENHFSPRSARKKLSNFHPTISESSISLKTWTVKDGEAKGLGTLGNALSATGFTRHSDQIDLLYTVLFVYSVVNTFALCASVSLW